jgi:hypothetical protein
MQYEMTCVMWKKKIKKIAKNCNVKDDIICRDFFSWISLKFHHIHIWCQFGMIYVTLSFNKKNLCVCKCAKVLEAKH